MSIKAVAKLAKASTWTMSRTINGSAKVSPGIPNASAMGLERCKPYPDPNARALGSGRSNPFDLIISDITNPFFPELVQVT